MDSNYITIVVADRGNDNWLIRCQRPQPTEADPSDKEVGLLLNSRVSHVLQLFLVLLPIGYKQHKERVDVIRC